MASSNIEICNAALIMIGEDTISSLTESSKRARVCANIYPSALDACLRLHPWNFAIKRVNLPPTNDVPAYGYSYVFNLPSEFLRLLEIYSVTDYKIERRQIFTDESTLYVRGVFRNENVTEYDALFVMMLQAYMAMLIALPLTKSNTIKEEMQDLFKGFLSTAKAVDAQEEPADTIGDFPLIDIRG